MQSFVRDCEGKDQRQGEIKVDWGGTSVGKLKRGGIKEGDKKGRLVRALVWLSPVPD